MMPLISPLRTISCIILAAVSSTAVRAADFHGCNFTPEQTAAAGCVCIMPNVRPAAYLDQITGEVLKTDVAGYTPIGSHAAGLNVGDRVVFSGTGQAVFSAPNCAATVVGPNDTLVVRPLEPSCACAALLPALTHVPLVMGLILLGVATNPVSP